MRTFTLLIIIGCCLTSCSKWLDVKPQSEVSQDVLFSTEEGFQEALNGVYSRCAQEDSYGKEITCGILDVMAQNYTIPSLDGKHYRQTALFNYKDDSLIARKDRAWKALYNGVANSNLILQHIEGKQKMFSGTRYSLIKGEALALRGYFHFDALRMFAPSYVSNANAKGVPYVTVFSKAVTPISSVAAVLDSVIADLNNAKELLRTSDPILSGGYIVGYPLKDSSTETAGELFLQQRRHRMNYYAVCGTLARVYLYKGDKANALNNALEIINANKFPWTKQNNFLNPDPEKKDRILYKELIFGWYIPNRTDNLKDLFRSGSQSLHVATSEGQIIYEVASVGGDDFRYKQWLSEQSESSGTYLQLEKYTRDGDANLHYQMAPAIRLSEIYYIAAECTFDSDPEKAWGYFNTVRLNRGIGATITNEPSRDVFLNELVKECRKEFYGEGQIFYMYKRLNRAIVGQSGILYSPADNIFVLPLPDDEIQFGTR
ncbi:RagB/SusD family nutrient uptake outer membrane protein [Chitinophaga oryziterrae]|uniref:RagB/SusD family nutrient uptake outer membrane protein n=1 Tax=Chitinophaga oryziterrae TaxID=1031224 RepID=A0A6N8JFS6_9BACT|nr:RagB/SusD family nutrient uptake outer membrane protein [Chitinophaga oryziterrae]MVT44047.1 RagB/SusD family nutrient uptake outer membrane protein [Chitinophaga oryziterrae]